MSRTIKIGTRGSKLALWQAHKVQELLKNEGLESELHIIHSTGDKDRKAKLHEMGLVGVFTKELDDALLIGEIDVAVHSLKDVPTLPPKGIVQCAVLERASPFDVLISSGDSEGTMSLKIGTGSLRRRAFWKNKFPADSLHDLRGNVPTRLEKLEAENFDGIILAKAGLDRLEIKPENTKVLDWMLPAPAQGIVGVFCLSKNEVVFQALQRINNSESELCAKAERDFLKTLEGGCTAPIGALAVMDGENISLKGALLSEDGKMCLTQEMSKPLAQCESLGEELANELLKSGGKEIMESFKNSGNLPKVLCLKKLTPPRIKRAEEMGLALDSVEVIQTVTDYNPIEVKNLLNSSNNYIFSSLNSVSALNSVLKKTAMIHKHIYCVGNRAAHFFEGKVKSITQVKQVSELLEIAKNSGEKSFSWFHSDLSDLSLVEQFAEEELELNHTAVYKTELLSPKIEDVDQYQALLFFSPSGVRSFLENNTIPENAKVGAIGPVTAEALDGRANYTPTDYEFNAFLKATKHQF